MLKSFFSFNKESLKLRKKIITEIDTLKEINIDEDGISQNFVFENGEEITFCIEADHLNQTVSFSFYGYFNINEIISEFKKITDIYFEKFDWIKIIVLDVKSINYIDYFVFEDKFGKDNIWLQEGTNEKIYINKSNNEEEKNLFKLLKSDIFNTNFLHFDDSFPEFNSLIFAKINTRDLTIDFFAKEINDYIFCFEEDEIFSETKEFNLFSAKNEEDLKEFLEILHKRKKMIQELNSYFKEKLSVLLDSSFQAISFEISQFGEYLGYENISELYYYSAEENPTTTYDYFELNLEEQYQVIKNTIDKEIEYLKIISFFPEEINKLISETHSEDLLMERKKNAKNNFLTSQRYIQSIAFKNLGKEENINFTFSSPENFAKNYLNPNYDFMEEHVNFLYEGEYVDKPFKDYLENLKTNIISKNRLKEMFNIN